MEAQLALEVRSIDWPQPIEMREVAALVDSVALPPAGAMKPQLWTQRVMAADF